MPFYVSLDVFVDWKHLLVCSMHIPGIACLLSTVPLPALCPESQSPPQVAIPPFSWFWEVEGQRKKRAKLFSVPSQGQLSITSR